MPKKADATRSKMRLKSTRKPLRDASNVNTAVKPAAIHEKTSEDNGGKAGDDSLDRLLLVHSDISSLLRQIDELVVQALQSTSDNGRKEIKQFADVLSDMHTSLKPWVSTFQNVVNSQSTEPENKPKPQMESQKENTSTAIESPQETKWESLISPSPLVSWRAGCNTGNGRQLFLLTPLPQKKEYQAKPTEEMAFDVEVAESAVNILQTDTSLAIMTPCMKMSPPKSCKLLEPISAFSKKKSQLVHKCTPFPTRVNSVDSDSCSDESSDGLRLKYPELYGIKRENMQRTVDAEDSPSWIISPPKTCVVLNPTNPSDTSNQPLKPIAVSNQEGIIRALDLADFTPMMKETTTSNFRTGKHPGENTLKKELWTRFEAASSYGVSFDSSLLRNNTKKGFLDILDEASDA